MVELSSRPSLTVLYPKAVLTGFRRKGGELPDTEYTLSGVTTDRAHLAAYNRVCGFRLTDELPATYPHLLAFPLQIKLMAGGDFPFPLVGSVHVANRITQTRPLRVGEKLDLRVHLENLRDHPRGRQFDMVGEALVDGEVVWTDVSTYLRRGGGEGRTERTERTETPAPTAIWRVPDDIGRRYGEVSGDRNPIHLYALTAKAFGFPRQIAHGMWSMARCVGALENRLPGQVTVAVAFKKPILLPGTVAFGSRRTDDGYAFSLSSPGRGAPHLAGRASR
jgi:hypothetical protein